MLSNSRSVHVEFGHCDPSGIVFNPNYFIWFDSGMSLKSLIGEFGIDGIPLVDNKAQFKAPSRWGDDLIIETTITALHRSAFELRHVVRNGEVVAVECSETRVWTVFDAEQGRIRAAAIPPQVVAVFSG